MFRNVGIQNSDPGESPKRKNTTFTTQQKIDIYAALSVREVHCTKIRGSSSGASAWRGVRMSIVARLFWPNCVVVFLNFFRRILVRVYYSRLPIVRHCRDRHSASLSALEPFSHLQYLHLLSTPMLQSRL